MFLILLSVFSCIYGFQASKYLDGAKHIPAGINPIPKSEAVLQDHRKRWMGFETAIT